MYYCEHCAKELLTPVVVWDDEFVFCSKECEEMFFGSMIEYDADFYP